MSTHTTLSFKKTTQSKEEEEIKANTSVNWPNYYDLY